MSGQTAVSEQTARSYGVTADESMAIADFAIISRLEQFYFREARLLDERKFQQWLGLLTQDLEYTMPSRFIATPNPRERGTEAFHAVENELERGELHGVPIRQEGYMHLAMRVERSYKVNAWAENPPARTRRFVSNVEVFESEDGYVCYSNLSMVYNRHDNADHTLTAQRRDQLRLVDGELKIAKREIIHDWNVITAPTLGLYF